ncbi:hypothetical protein BGZ80_005761, partial [Entomortierella chlamydospora]
MFQERPDAIGLGSTHGVVRGKSIPMTSTDKARMQKKKKSRTWSQKIQVLVSDNNDWETKILRDGARKALCGIMYEPNLLRARERIKEFRDNWGRRFPEFTQDMEANYFNRELRTESWMTTHRQELYDEMDTNNFMESWHNLLKNHFLKGRQISFLRYFKLDEFQENVRVGRKSKGEIMDTLCQRKV